MSVPFQPRADPNTTGFWAATARGELALCCCSACGRFTHPPTERCPRCAGPMVWKAVAGKGELYSFIVVHRAVVPGSEPGDLIGLVELAEQPGLRLAARLVDVDPDRVRIGMPVQARLVPLPGGDFVVPVFGPPG